MPDRTAYETGVREPVKKTRPDANEEVSQDAATNKLPPTPFGNSESMEDASERTRHADGEDPPTPKPAMEQVAGAGPAIAERSKDARTETKGRQPGAYVEDDPLPGFPDGGRGADQGSG